MRKRKVVGRIYEMKYSRKGPKDRQTGKQVHREKMGHIVGQDNTNNRHLSSYLGMNPKCLLRVSYRPWPQWLIRASYRPWLQAPQMLLVNIHRLDFHRKPSTNRKARRCPQLYSLSYATFVTQFKHKIPPPPFFLFLSSSPFPSFVVPTGSPSRGGVVAAYVFNVSQPSLPTPFYSVLMTVCL